VRPTRIPKLCLHKPSGRAYFRIKDECVYVGKYGTPEAQKEYERRVAEWLAAGRQSNPPPSGSALVSELILAFISHAEAYYRDSNGEPTGEATNFKDALKPVLRLYGDIPAAEFGTAQLKAARAAMVESGLSRGVVNARINRVRRVWKWGASESVVDAVVHSALMTVDPLRKHRTEAPESPGIAPVAEEVVRATLPHMPPPVAAMAELQLLTGCRVGEVLRVRVRDINRSVEPWEYTPEKHKNEHRDQRRMIPLGPRARAVVASFLDRKPDAYLFDPREVSTQETRDHYDRRSYAQAIRRACDRAFPHPTIKPREWTRTKRPTEEQRAELEAWRKAHRWSPLQIRHAVGTRVRAEHDLEAAQAVLGHARVDATQIYAERLNKVAREIAEETG